MGLLDRFGIGGPSEDEVSARVRAALTSAGAEAAEPATYLRLPQGGGSLSGVVAVPDVSAYGVSLRAAVDALVAALGGDRRAAPVMVYLTGRTPDGVVLTPADLAPALTEKPIVRDLRAHFPRV